MVYIATGYSLITPSIFYQQNSSKHLTLAQVIYAAGPLIKYLRRHPLYLMFGIMTLQEVVKEDIIQFIGGFPKYNLFGDNIALRLITKVPQGKEFIVPGGL